MNSRSKGARGERDARDAVRTYWGSKDCIRAAQANGSYSADLLNALPRGHVEVKRYKAIRALRFLEQAERDAQAGELPVVLMREDGDPHWVVMFRLRNTFGFVKRLLEVDSESAKELGQALV